MEHMNDSLVHDEPGPRGAEPGGLGKKPYRSPELTVHGSVQERTLDGAAVGEDLSGYS